MLLAFIFFFKKSQQNDKNMMKMYPACKAFKETLRNNTYIEPVHEISNIVVFWHV